MPVSSTRRRNAVTSIGSSGLPFHWLAFLVKTWSASQPCSCARSTALETPPATDMCAPIRIGLYNRLMRNLLLPLALVALLVPAPAHAWGYVGHKLIVERAIALLPPELRPLFERERNTLIERSIDPDTWRTAGFEEEPPNHQVDMDWEGFGKYPFAGLPRDYSAAVAKFGRARIEQEGTLPWRGEEM